MKRRMGLAVLVVVTMTQGDVHGLTPPSKSDGPVRLLACVVSGAGILEAEVDSQTDDTMTCNLRCNYEFGGKTLSYTFTETIRGRFNGRVGRFDTSGGKSGSYSGDVGTCKKADARA
jgi:hypothetical protein